VRALLLPVGPERYALALTGIREVVLSPAVEPLPGAPPAVLGVMNLRGEVVPVLDTAVLLGTGRLARAVCAVLADGGAGLAALAGDGEPATAMLGAPAGATELPGAAGRFACSAGGLATLLDLERLIVPDRIGAA
jgi:hypothetical protein